VNCEALEHPANVTGDSPASS